MITQPIEPPQMRTFAFRGPYLEQFPQLRRSLVANQFCFAVRAGAKTVEDVLAWVSRDCRRRITDPYTDDEARDLQRYLLATLEYGEASEFAEFILQREKLSPKDKQRLRAVDGQVYVEQHMAGLPPTQKQLDLLKRLGHPGTPTTRLEASRAIDSLLNRGGRR